jgi:hypothetical protein
MAGICVTTTLVFIMLFYKELNFQAIPSRLWNLTKTTDHRAENQACVTAKMELYPSQEFRDFFTDIPKPKCPGKNWVEIDRGVFRIFKSAKSKFRNIICDYLPILRGKDDLNHHFGKTIRNIRDGDAVSSVASKVNCSASGGVRHESYHLTVPHDERLKRRSKEVKLPEGALGMNVLMFGFDSVSRLTWKRKLPKSYDYMLNVLEITILENYNSVADGTLGALLPMLTGKSEPELPNVGKGKPGSTTLDGFPWIWNEFKTAGYVTQWIEDAASVNTFTWRMNGFKKQPMDYHSVHFYAEIEKRRRDFKQYCVGPELKHNVMFRWMTEFLKTYKHARTFSFGFNGECSHNDNHPLNIIDDDLKMWLEYLYTYGYLENTLLILMSDHGVRFHSIRETTQGKAEERNPFFSFRLPNWFKQKNPRVFQNLLINSKRLITPFDIHETLHDVLNFRYVAVGNVAKRSISIFSEIPASRTCEMAAISPHWCNCLNWKSMGTNSSSVRRAAHAFIDFANSMTAQVRDKCQILELDRIKEAVAYSGYTYIAKNDVHTKTPDLSDVLLYQLTVHANPGRGHFEVTVKHDLRNNNFAVDARGISRINAYWDTPACIIRKLPHLGPYCVCGK